MKLNPEQEKKLTKIRNICIQYRGMYIHHFVELETNIEWFLADYFCGHDKVKLTEITFLLLSNKIDFSKKFESFKYIVDTHVKKYSELNPQLMSTIKNLMELRNVLAHSKFICTDDTINNFDGETIVFENWQKLKGKINRYPFKFNTAIANSYSEKMNTTNKKLRELRALLLHAKDTKS